MARRIPFQYIIAFLLIFPALHSAWPLESNQILVSYSFDDDMIETGPDTFSVFEGGRGKVGISTYYRYSGYRSVELSDVAGDGDFPELQGYFKAIDSGTLFIRFSFMTTDAFDILNIALAGPKWFNLTKDGIGFWIRSKSGYLYHYSDSMPKKMFQLSAFVWYSVVLTYDISRGSYDLVIFQEDFSDPIVELYEQANAPNQPGSVVDKFSFVTDPFRDSSNLTYYVDDVIISVEDGVSQLGFAAPGRRKLFVDYWNEYQVRMRDKPNCLPAVELSDFAISQDDVAGFYGAGALEALNLAMSGEQIDIDNYRSLGSRGMDLIQAVAHWADGCEALTKGEASRALEDFEDSLRLAPEGRIYRLSHILALIHLRLWGQVYAGLDFVKEQMGGDLRFQIAEGTAGIASGRLSSARGSLKSVSEVIPEVFGEDFTADLFESLWASSLNQDVFNGSNYYQPLSWFGFKDRAALSEQYFFLLLWDGMFAGAEAYAAEMASRLEFLESPSNKWIERAGDAAFFADDCQGAFDYYNASLVAGAAQSNLYLKLSDASFCLGDLESERKYREKIYGSLKER